MAGCVERPAIYNETNMTEPTEKPMLPIEYVRGYVRLPTDYNLSALYIAPLSAPSDIEITPQGDLLIAENGLPRIRKVVIDTGEVSTYATLPESATALAYTTGGAGKFYRINKDRTPYSILVPLGLLV